MQTLIDTTFTGKNISSAASVYEYTSDGEYSLRVQVRLAAVAGNGDYIAYLTLNDGDGQSDDIIEPRTTATLDSGQTTCWFSTMTVDVKTGDVVNVFLTGQAGDTNESGSIRIFAENYAALDDILEGALTVEEALRVILATLAGKTTGGGTFSVAFRDVADSKDRVAATLDANRNRTAVTLDGT